MSTKVFEKDGTVRVPTQEMIEKCIKIDPNSQAAQDYVFTFFYTLEDAKRVALDNDGTKQKNQGLDHFPIFDVTIEGRKIQRKNVATGETRISFVGARTADFKLKNGETIKVLKIHCSQIKAGKLKIKFENASFPQLAEDEKLAPLAQIHYDLTNYIPQEPKLKKQKPVKKLDKEELSDSHYDAEDSNSEREASAEVPDISPDAIHEVNNNDGPIITHKEPTRFTKMASPLVKSVSAISAGIAFFNLGGVEVAVDMIGQFASSLSPESLPTQLGLSSLVTLASYGVMTGIEKAGKAIAHKWQRSKQVPESAKDEMHEEAKQKADAEMEHSSELDTVAKNDSRVIAEVEGDVHYKGQISLTPARRLHREKQAQQTKSHHSVPHQNLAEVIKAEIGKELPKKRC